MISNCPLPFYHLATECCKMTADERCVCVCVNQPCSHRFQLLPACTHPSPSPSILQGIITRQWEGLTVCVCVFERRANFTSPPQARLFHSWEWPQPAADSGRQWEAKAKERAGRELLLTPPSRGNQMTSLLSTYYFASLQYTDIMLLYQHYSLTLHLKSQFPPAPKIFITQSIFCCVMHRV